ncbi:hypothetical protein GOODEAATRI_006823 [Goodea atripinnis]|uniref:Uncharacterized protein n=1 Tax=Goodea atripinnis TaxID=208336 RepID=A0ABV0PC30_9TELE
MHFNIIQTYFRPLKGIKLKRSRGVVRFETQHVFLLTLRSIVHTSFCQRAAVLLPSPPAGVQLSAGTFHTSLQFEAHTSDSVPLNPGRLTTCQRDASREQDLHLSPH